MSYSVKHFYDKSTSTLSYIVTNSASKDALIIDPVLNYDPATARVHYESVDLLTAYLNDQSLNPIAILETHVHADHLSGAHRLKEIYPSIKVAISEHITEVQEIFKNIYHLDSFDCSGSQFDCLLKDDQEFSFGSFTGKALSTPGHTPACLSYHIGDFLFVGDALFMPDFGTGRCDFPGGDANTLYQSIAHKIYRLAKTTQIYHCHDYQPNGRELKFCSTLEEQLEKNIHLNINTPSEEFVSFRQLRDKTLSAPKLLLPSIQFNMNGNQFLLDQTHKPYLKIPIQLKE